MLLVHLGKVYGHAYFGLVDKCAVLLLVWTLIMNRCFMKDFHMNSHIDLVQCRTVAVISKYASASDALVGLQTDSDIENKRKDKWTKITVVQYSRIETVSYLRRKKEAYISSTYQQCWTNLLANDPHANSPRNSLQDPEISSCQQHVEGLTWSRSFEKDDKISEKIWIKLGIHVQDDITDLKQATIIYLRGGSRSRIRLLPTEFQTSSTNRKSQCLTVWKGTSK